MTCQEFWDGMPELGAEVPEHVAECPSCAARLEQHRRLAAGLKRLAAERGREAPPAIELRLRQAFREEFGGKRAPARHRWLAWGAAAAAVIIAALLALGGGRHANKVASAPPQSSELVDSAFIPLPYEAGGSPSMVPSDDADLVEVEVPRSALVTLGVPVPADDGAGPVAAVIALGADGMLEGVRILQ